MSKLADEIKALTEKFSAFMSRTSVVSLDTGDKLEIKCKEDRPDVGDSVHMNGKEVADGQYKTAETGEVFVVAGGRIADIQVQEAEVTTFDQETVKEFVAASMMAVGVEFRKVAEGQAEVIALMSKKLETVEAMLAEKEESRKKSEGEAITLIAEIKTLKDAVMSTYTPPAGNYGANGGSSVAYKAPTMAEELKKIRERTSKT